MQVNANSMNYTELYELYLNSLHLKVSNIASYIHVHVHLYAI